ncbi:MAG TPA: nitrilase family protein, partial [Chromatiales bacterium]|nr:nitrilase family protein [Chromatiales bacterium]
LPEMFTSGFTMQPEDIAEDLHGPTLEWMQDVAKTHDLTLTGSYVVREAGQYFNRLIWMPPDGKFGCYDKRHLFRMAGEHQYYAPGRERQVFRLDGWRVCPLICYDLRFPVFSRGLDEYDLLLYVANWPAARRSAWTTLLPARAVENLCYVAGVNRTGTDANGIEYAGGSGVWDYLGRTLAEADDQPRNITVTLDGDALLRYRQKFPAHHDADRFQLLDD